MPSRDTFPISPRPDPSPEDPVDLLINNTFRTYFCACPFSATELLRRLQGRESIQGIERINARFLRRDFRGENGPLEHAVLAAKSRIFFCTWVQMNVTNSNYTRVTMEQIYGRSRSRSCRLTVEQIFMDESADLQLLCMTSAHCWGRRIIQCIFNIILSGESAYFCAQSFGIFLRQLIETQEWLTNLAG